MPHVVFKHNLSVPFVLRILSYTLKSDNLGLIPTGLQFANSQGKEERLMHYSVTEDYS